MSYNIYNETLYFLCILESKQGSIKITVLLIMSVMRSLQIKYLISFGFYHLWHASLF